MTISIQNASGFSAFLGGSCAFAATGAWGGARADRVADGAPGLDRRVCIKPCRWVGLVAWVLMIAVSAAVADGPLRIEAQDGGVVALSGLTRVSTQAGDAVEIRAVGAGSRIELPALSHFYAFSGDGQSLLEASAGGHILLRDDRTWLGRNVELRIGVGGTAEAGRLDLGFGARLSGSGQLDADLVNAGSVGPGATAGNPDGSTGILTLVGSYRQDPLGELVIELAGNGPGSRCRAGRRWTVGSGSWSSAAGCRRPAPTCASSIAASATVCSPRPMACISPNWPGSTCCTPMMVRSWPPMVRGSAPTGTATATVWPTTGS